MFCLAEYTKGQQRLLWGGKKTLVMTYIKENITFLNSVL